MRTGQRSGSRLISPHPLCTLRRGSDSKGSDESLIMESARKAKSELERIEKQIAHLENSAGGNQEARHQLQQLHEKVAVLRSHLETQFTAWRKAELARHPQRPYTLDYVEKIFSDWTELHGDRGFGDDPAIVC